MRGAALIIGVHHARRNVIMGVHHSIFTDAVMASDAVMANSVPQILYKSCKIQKVVLHKQKNGLASMKKVTQNQFQVPGK